MSIKNNATVFLTGLIVAGVVVYVGYALLGERTDESRNFVGVSTEAPRGDDQQLRLKELADKSITEVKIVASSTQDGNAVVEIDGRIIVFNVGDKVTIGGDNYLVLQVVSQQLALRALDGRNQNDIFLIKKDLSSGVSSMLRVSSDFAIESPVSGTPSIKSN